MTLLQDAAFWCAIATTVAAVYKFSLSQAYRSKCTDVNLCCGMCRIKRNVEVEQRIDEFNEDLEEPNPAPPQRASISSSEV